MSTPNFKDGQPLPTADQNVSVIGGLDSAGNVQAFAAGTDGSVVMGGSGGGALSSIPVSSAAGLNGVPSGNIGWVRMGTDAVEAGSTTTAINLTAHILRVGDAVVMVSGTAANVQAWSIVTSAPANAIAISPALPATPVAADVLNILRPIPISASSSVSANASAMAMFVDQNYQPTTASGLMKAEDSASGSGDSGVGVLGVINTTLAARASDGDYEFPALDTAGASLGVIVPPSGLAAGLSPTRVEDAAFANGDAVIMSGAVINEGAGTTFSTTQLDIVPNSANRYGVLYSEISWLNQQNGANGILKREDDAHSNSDAGVMMLSVNNVNAAAFNATQGDYTPQAVNGYGSVIGDGGSFVNITSATTTTAKSGAGWFHRLIINKAVASATITIYDNTAASGTKIGTITLPGTLTENNFELDYSLRFGTGLTLVTSGATDLTVVFD